MKRITALAAVLVVAGAGVANAQAQDKASGSSASAAISFAHGISKNFLTKTAEQVPENLYAFQPTKEVRTLGAILGHVADAQKMFCAVAEGKQAPSENAGSENLKDKAALVAVLKESFAYCEQVTAKLTEADLAKPVSLFGMSTNVAGILTLNAAHNMEHYGNLVTYMRINNIVPPSSQN